MSSAALAIDPLATAPDAVIRVPGSKSITNRALLLAALAEGRSSLTGALFSDDTRFMSSALRELGVDVSADEGSSRIEVDGCGGVWPAGEASLYVGNAGTAMRFLAAALCLGRGSYRLDGGARMRQRPIAELVEALGQWGADIRCEMGNGCPPVVVDAGGLAGGVCRVDASRSSQFLTALLQVAPCGAAAAEIQVPGGLISAPYIDMTIAVMREFGATVEHDSLRHFRIRAGQGYVGRDYRIEPDASSAHYFWAAAALTGGRVRTEGLGRDSLQGDLAFADVLEQMGADVERAESHVEVVGNPPLRGIDVDMNAISDTAPTLAVLGAFASSPVNIRNVEHLRWQESDRLAAVACELGRLGCRVDERRDGLTVYPSRLQAAAVETYDDHRIAMSFALVGLVVEGVCIRDPDCVAKTFPDYFDRLEDLRQ